ncbi:MAG: glycosyl hydrolase-related protein [Treponema sp.]|jgi:alpha-mannosidase|nr:glycosyl hydrolase-related protein [Treponema sp.]
MLLPKAEGRISQYLEFLERNSYRKIAALDFEIFETGKTYREPPADAQWRKIGSPAPWGKAWNCAWFRASYRAPESRRPLFLSVLPNADSLAFIDGKPAGAFNMFHRKLRIGADGAEHSLHLEAYAGHPYNGSGPLQGEKIIITLGKQLASFPNSFEGGFLLERLPALYSLYYDVLALCGAAKELDKDSLRRARIIKGLLEALGELSLSSAGEASAEGGGSPAGELEEQAARAAEKLSPLLRAKNGDTVPTVCLIGHAHIDHAWLWHIGETERKAARTFINMTRFAAEYPEFVFVQSQPCQMEIVRNEYPSIFEAVKEAFKKGAWEPNGGMWVEADCNIPSGESLIRQFLYGKAFNREAFNYEADTLWLPDVFGYAAALPQILKGCRIKYFVTSKINWNDTTRFPYDTFIWRGIDGTGIRTHFITARAQGYNGRVSPESLAETWREVQHKEIQSGVVKSVGEGDGGGGTMRADLETARRLGNLEGVPKAVWKPVSAALEEIFSQDADWPEWRGELYLELHRGTYTTQGRTKRNNRRAEFALRHAEWIAALSGEAYPREELDKAWKGTLTLQFHDIIPGSSIRRVYQEAEAAHAGILADLALLGEKRRRSLLDRSGADTLVFNDLSWERSDPQAVPAEKLGKNGSRCTALRGADGAVYPVEYFKDIEGRETALFTPKLPPLGWKAFTRIKGDESPGDSSPESASPDAAFHYQDGLLETPFYRVRFEPCGRIGSLTDLRRGAELVAPGGSFNRFVSAEDVPVYWEAWDIDADWTRYLKEENSLVSSELISRGPLSFRIRQSYRIASASTLVQDLVFYREDPRIDFQTKVDWRERRRLLKVGFDTAIDSGEVRCEVQYGHVFRNTHRNLPQDRAKFEICAHKWISVEEGAGGGTTGSIAGGIALLNDCKYGHDVSPLAGPDGRTTTRMRLTLLRSPKAPDPEADCGVHYFTYALLPFTGGFAASRSIRGAYELNSGAVLEAAARDAGERDTAASGGKRAAKTGEPGADYSLCSVEGAEVIVECVKAPESGGGGLALRLYESLGGRARTVLRFSSPIARAEETDMLEGNGRPLPFTGRELPLEFRPFEIKTLLVKLG